MDQNDKVANDKISKLESEIKVLKNEVQAVLLDLRESYLNVQNPFNSNPNPSAVQPIVITQQTAAPEEKSEPMSRDFQRPEALKAEKSPSSMPMPETITQSATEHLKTETSRHFEPRTHLELERQPARSSEIEVKKSPRLDLAVVAALMGWVDEATKKLGKERTEAILDISEAMGYVPDDLKPILVKLIALAPKSTADSPLRTRDYINSLIKINSLLGKDNREETALLLLSLVSGDQNNG
jgi:hypothetical protein